MKIRSILVLIVILTCMTWQCSTERATVQRIQNGVQLETATLNVKVQFYADDLARVVKWLPQAESAKTSLVVIQNEIPDLKVEFQENQQTITLRSEKMSLTISKYNGKIDYFDLNNKIIVQEEGKAIITPSELKYEQAFSVQQKFKLTPNEAIYGLGQHQDGYMNYRGRTVKLVQTNTDAVTPFLISTQKYGILWDNYSKTVFEDNQNQTSLWSEVGDNIDYYFIYGNDMDDVIAGYRNLTGHAPMYGKWAYGYWQSKEHYENRAELLSVVHEYRQRKIPIDNIIQDWDYWDGRENWSQMFFDAKKYPRPEEMINVIHNLNFHIMISIWPGLGPNTTIYKEMAQKGYLFNTVGWGGFKYYDAYNPESNNLYWQYLKKGLFSTGIDAWWIDSTEPDIVNATMKDAEEYEMKKVGKNYLGSWARYLNTYSLAMTESLYKNQRQETDQKRVYILTRSAFAGQQRCAATTWSGDIGASWEIYKKQIAAGVNFCMAGIPYWTFDIGAFVIGAYGGVFINGGKYPAYQELYTRMFQFGAFCPIFRAHGSETPREIWQFGEFVPSLLKFDQMRYRLLPYIYSLAWQVTNDGYTIMRGLPMDFTADSKTYSIDDQFMFGPAMMVCPVTEYMIHRPPAHSILIAPEHFKTTDGKPGILAKYYKDPDYKTLTHQQVEPNIDHLWYTGRPDYMTDSTFAVRWEGKLIPAQTGKHQFHLVSYDAKRIFLDGKQLPIVYTSVEQYTDFVELEANREYDFVLEMENRSTGAAKMKLCWKTPEIFATEQIVEQKPKTRSVYLPARHQWIDFWTGEMIAGGQSIVRDAPIDKIPLLVKAGSIIPLGPFIQYSNEKPADPIELRIYPGADASFVLYEDENDNYNYEKGSYATIAFHWDDAKHRLKINDRKGVFPGMLEKRTFNIVLVRQNHGTEIQITDKPDKIVFYQGEQQVVQF
ncbi:MAG TPA: TIM-barrel domain-containing protein [bacterium]